MKGLMIIAACLALTFVLEGLEKIRTMKQESVRVPAKGADNLQEALNKYKDLME